MEDQENEFNQIIKTQLEEHDTDDNMNNFMNKIATAAEQTIPDNKTPNRKQDCDPEILRLINIRKEVVMTGNEENIKEISKVIKKTARRIRTKKMSKDSKKTNGIS